MLGFKKTIFMNKVVNAIAPQKNIEDIEPLDLIMIKLFFVAYGLKENKKIRYLNKNKICLFDTCIFIVYIIRWVYYSKKFIHFQKREQFDNELCAYLAAGFDKFFKCKEILNVSIMLSRIDFYDEILENYEDEHGKNDICRVLEAFKNIIKCDLINKHFIKVSFDSPLYVLRTLEDNLMCDAETQYALDAGLENFSKELNNLINNYNP